MGEPNAKIRSILNKIKATGRDISDFHEANITDVLIPFPDSGLGLPSGLRNDKPKLNRFKRKQAEYVETNGQCLDKALEAPDGYKMYFHLSEPVIDQHFSKRELGSGGYSKVFELQPKHSVGTVGTRRDVVAMKWIVRPGMPTADFSEDNEEANAPDWKWLAHIGEGHKHCVYPDKQQRSFEAEVKILRKIREITHWADQESKWSKVKEDHIIKIRASFTDPTAFGILLSPVAFFSLEDLLKKFSDAETDSIVHPTDSDAKTTFYRIQLLGCVGCVASSVLFLHKSNIRHKDLKTKNFLIYPSKEDGTNQDWKICVCDFATASDYSGNPKSMGQTTEPVFRPRSKYVEAPETIDGRVPRNISEDMWHVGCVLLEILLEWKGKTKEDLHREVAQASATLDSLQLHHKMLSREDLSCWLDGLKSEHVEDLIEWVKNLLLAKGPNYIRTRMTSEKLVEDIGTKVSMGQEVLAQDCCRGFYPLSIIAFKGSIKEATLYVPGQSELQITQSGSIRVLDSQKLNLERRLEISGGTSDVILPPVWLPVTGMRITYNKQKNPNQVIVKWSDFNQESKRPFPPPTDYRFYHWLGFKPEDPNWKFDVHFEEAEKAAEFIDVLVAVHGHATGTAGFKKIIDKQSFAIQSVTSERSKYDLGTILWPNSKDCYNLLKILIMKEKDRFSCSYTTYFVRHETQRLDIHLQDRTLRLRGLETITYKGSKERESTSWIPKEYTSAGLKLDSKSSLPQDLELQLPSDFFDGHLRLDISRTACETHTLHVNTFLSLMGDLLGCSLEWICSVHQVKEIQHFRPFDKKFHILNINMEACILMLWRVEIDDNPWLVLRQMGKDLGQATWWYGQVKEIKKTKREKRTNNVVLRYYQQNVALHAGKFHRTEREDPCELEIEFHDQKDCLFFGGIQYG